MTISGTRVGTPLYLLLFAIYMSRQVTFPWSVNTRQLDSQSLCGSLLMHRSSVGTRVKVCLTAWRTSFTVCPACDDTLGREYVFKESKKNRIIRSEDNPKSSLFSCFTKCSQLLIMLVTTIIDTDE